LRIYSQGVKTDVAVGERVDAMTLSHSPGRLAPTTFQSAAWQLDAVNQECLNSVGRLCEIVAIAEQSICLGSCTVYTVCSCACGLTISEYVVISVCIPTSSQGYIGGTGSARENNDMSPHPSHDPMASTPESQGQTERIRESRSVICTFQDHPNS
jgi:hypothetical protein